MFKKLIKGLVAGGAALTIAASAASAADTIEVNIFGASAQYKFWTAAAPEYLKSICNRPALDVYAATNETEAELNKADPDYHDRDSGIAVCAGVNAFAGVTGQGYTGDGDTLIIRYTTNSSYDGPMSVLNDDTFDADNCPTDGDRLQASPKVGELALFPLVGNSIDDLTCMDVHVGASDVSVKTFQQTSDGFSAGPLGSASSIINRTISYPSTVQDPADVVGFQVDNPIVVPFGFFANNDAATPVPVDNLSRLMAINLFSGQYANWNELDPTYPDMPVTVCHRAAGSGTVATLNAAVFRGDKALPTRQQDGTFGSPYFNPGVQFGFAPAIYFNKGSSDATRCAGNVIGAVSYADSDKCVNGCGDKFGKVKAIAYQGVGGDLNADTMSDAMKYGRHIFWAAQYLYSNQTGEVDAQIDGLVAFASQDANMPPAREDFWAAQGAMNWEKATDFAWPTKK